MDFTLGEFMEALAKGLALVLALPVLFFLMWCLCQLIALVFPGFMGL